MTTIREIVAHSVVEPYKVKIERGQKGGYGYELSVAASSGNEAITEIISLKNRLEAELYGKNPDSVPV